MQPKLYDLSYLKELSSGDLEFEHSMIDYFITNTPDVIDTMDRLIIQEDWNEIREVIHRFIPNLNMVGAKEFLEDANNIELFTEKRYNLENVPSLWGNVKKGCIELLEQLTNDFQ